MEEINNKTIIIKSLNNFGKIWSLESKIKYYLLSIASGYHYIYRLCQKLRFLVRLKANLKVWLSTFIDLFKD